ncbi:MAG: hypothetical protein AAGB04_00305 [Pseudomonadota bacterium]
MSSDHINDPRLVGAMPVLRRGDQVFIINDMPSIRDMQNSMLHFKRYELMLDNYRCPFSIIEEFEKWWEWHYRTRAKKESTGSVIVSMLTDVDRIKRHKIERTMEFRTSDMTDAMAYAMNASRQAIIRNATA